MKREIPKDAVKIESLREQVIEQPEVVIEELFRVMKPKGDRCKEMLAVYGSFACAEIEGNFIQGSSTSWREIMTTFLIHFRQDDIKIYEEDVRVLPRAISRNIIFTCDIPATNPAALGQLYVALSGGLEFISAE